MIDLFQLAERLEDLAEKAAADIAAYMPDGIDPALAKDNNGRYLLLDAYASLASLRAVMTQDEWDPAEHETCCGLPLDDEGRCQHRPRHTAPP